MDNTGSRLAFVAPGDDLDHLFDTTTIEPMGSWIPAPPIVPTFYDGRFCGLEMGRFSCLLRTRLDCRTEIEHSCRFHLNAKPRVIAEILQFNAAQAPAINEDEAFVACVCREDPVAIQIFDTRSRAMMLTYEMSLPGGVEDLGPVSLTWIGAQLLVILSASKKSGKATDHMLVLHL